MITGVSMRADRRVLVLLAVLAGLTVVNEAGGATIQVDCGANPDALTSALASAGDGDTLVIHGTCLGSFEVSKSVTLHGTGQSDP